MRRSLVGGAVAACVTFTSAPAVRRMLLAVKSLDIPNDRSSHATPVPRGGGIASFLGVAAGAAVIGEASALGRREIAGITLLAATGLADDQAGHLSPSVRLAAQGIAGVLFARSPLLSVPTIIGTAGVVNAVNFMDGINGISGGTAVVWGASTLLAGRTDQNAAIQSLAALTLGGAAGFLPWNVPSAQMFLGDVGSYLIGGLMAATLSRAAPRPGLAWRAAAPLLPYAADVTQALIRRGVGGRPLTEAHREHIYQRLIDQHGLTHVQVSSSHALMGMTLAALSSEPIDARRAVAAAAVIVAYLASPSALRTLRSATS